MIATRFTELVGCTVPIQQAGMGAVAPPELAAAVSEAGALGMLGTAHPGLTATFAGPPSPSTRPRPGRSRQCHFLPGRQLARWSGSNRLRRSCGSSSRKAADIA